MPNAYVSSLSIYPLKSSAPIHQQSVKVLTSGLVGDRRFMLTQMDGKFITGRTHPKVRQIQCEYRDDQIILMHPSCEPLTLDSANLSSQYYATAVWGTEFLGQGCGYDADQWVSALLEEPLRILYFGDKSNRSVVGFKDTQVGFADGYPLLLTNDQSLEHLNQRLIAPVSMANFRPNITFSGVPAWAEDEWHKIQIGDVVFELPKPCSRCIFTTLDPHSTTFDSNKDPLKTLASYRQAVDAKDVNFGENMVALNEGVINVGDIIKVLETKAKPVYIDNWPASNKRLTKQLAISSDQPKESAQMTLRCINIVQETSDVKTFVFSADPIQRFTYLPGQFITINAQINNQTIKRCYTLSSSPSKPDTISITVKRVKSGVVSNWLHDHFAIGSSLTASAPAGVFHLHGDNRDKLLLLSAGSGITPMLSIIRYINDLSLNINVHFHHSAKTEADFIGCAELIAAVEKNDKVSLSVNYTRIKTEQQVVNKHERLNYNLGYLNTQTMTDYCPDFLDRDVFVCGPEGFMVQTKELLLTAGLDIAQYDQESFVIDSSQIEPEAADQHYKVTFLLSDIEVDVAGDQTILEAAEAAGIYPDYSCLSGVCGSCTSTLVAGKVHAPDALAIDVDDPGNTDFLPCCSYARSDLQVEL